MIELAGEVADGAFLMVGLHPAAIRAARSHLEDGARRAGRSLIGFPVIFVTTLGLGADIEVGMRWVRSWFAQGQPFLNYPSASNLRWLKEAGFELEEAHDPAAIPELGRAKLRMHLDCSVHQSVAQSASCRRERKQALSKCSCFPPMTSPEPTRCRKLRSRLLRG